MKIKNLFIALFFSLSAIPGFSESQQQLHIDADTGGKTWETSANGAHFLMRQILPEQLQGFYLSRGFSLKEIEPYTVSCVFMTVLRNNSAPAGLHFKRDNLKVSQGGKQHSLVSVEKWVQRLRDINSKKSAVIAFRWAQFPIDQVFEPGGDWNQGMVSVGLLPESHFDAVVNWDIGGKPFEIKLEGVECVK